MTNAISVKNLAVKYNDHTVLDSISFTLEQDKLVYITGGNGSGKSTLIKAIMGLVERKSGDIKIFGNPLSQKVVAKHVGYVPQSISIDRTFPITVKEVIDLECSLAHECGLTPGDHLKVFDAHHLMNKQIRNLSGGELQKVLIARALVSNPDILILDEPTNNLDKKARKSLDTIILNIHKKTQRTILVVTHDHSITHGRIADASVLHIQEGKLYINHEEE